MVKLNYSPRLQSVMKEIEALLEKNDIAGCVYLYHDGKGEYLHHLNTSKSVIRNEGEGLRYRSKLSEFNGDQDKKREADEYSIGMLRLFMDVMIHPLKLFSDIYAHTKEVYEITHSEAIYTSHEEGMNG